MDLWCNETSFPEEDETEFYEEDKKVTLKMIKSDEVMVVEESSSSESSFTTPDSIPALKDVNMLNDNRVLERLLLSEDRGLPPDASVIFDKVQDELRPQMRDILTKWMLEVCGELRCETIFPSSVNYLDRFLSLLRVSKEELQLLGSVCLLIASKLRQCQSIHPDELVYFTASTYTVSQITECEMLVLTTLKWDVSTVVSTDFIDHLMARLHLICKQIDLNPLIIDSYMEDIRKVAIGLCLLCSREMDFMNEKPSVVATSAVVYALHYCLFQNLDKFVPLKKLSSQFEEVTGIACNNIERCLSKLSQDLPGKPTSKRLRKAEELFSSSEKLDSIVNRPRQCS